MFRARFSGKVSPIHLFWGALDLACTRFSGRAAPEHRSVAGLPDRVTRDAYSHEVSSCGFWPGTPGIEPLFYSYAYPEPPGYAESPIQPAIGAFNLTLGEFVLPYEGMRRSADPDGALLEFLQSTYEAAAMRALGPQHLRLHRLQSMSKSWRRKKSRGLDCGLIFRFANEQIGLLRSK
jgi:hypothetical protein